MRGGGDETRLGYVEAGVGGHDADHRVPIDRPGGRRTSGQERSHGHGGIDEPLAILRACPGDDAPALRVDDVAKGVHRDEGRYDERARPQAGGAESRLGGARHPKELTHRGAHAGAHIPLGHTIHPGVAAGAIAHGGIGAHRGVAQGEVKEHGAGHDGHPCHTGVVADALLLEVAHDAIGGGEPKGAAPRQQHGVRPLHEGSGTQEVRLAGAGRQPWHGTAGDGTLAAEDHRTAGERLRVIGVPHLNPRDVGQRPGRQHAADGALSHGMPSTARPRDPRCAQRPLPWAAGAAGRGRHRE